jgi:hypothetical protein
MFVSPCLLSVTRIIYHELRNVNEQKDPLPLPEGRCDRSYRERDVVNGFFKEGKKGNY